MDHCGANWTQSTEPATAVRAKVFQGTPIVNGISCGWLQKLKMVGGPKKLYTQKIGKQMYLQRKSLWCCLCRSGVFAQSYIFSSTSGNRANQLAFLAAGKCGPSDFFKRCLSVTPLWRPRSNRVPIGLKIYLTINNVR